MQPNLLFDKSFLQSLNVDESVWLDAFYRTLITPVFYVETLADLSKLGRAGRAPEDEVRIIADKFPEVHGSPTVSHQSLCEGELRGYPVPMNGYQIPVPGGRPVQSEGKKGWVFARSPELDAFQRWQSGKFFEIERDFAFKWRAAVEELDLLAVARRIRDSGLSTVRPKSFDEALGVARRVVDDPDNLNRCFDLLGIFLGLPPELIRRAKQHARKVGIRKFSVLHPYCAHVLTVELYFQVAVHAGLIADTRPSNRVDIMYLFYMPFCMIFVSADRLHQKAAAPFMRPRLRFVWGPDLKSDLKKLNSHFEAIDEAEKERGLFHIAHHPPIDETYLTTRLWNELIPGWKKMTAAPRPGKAETTSATELSRMVDRARRAPSATREDAIFDANAADFMTFERIVSRRKGSWYQLPKDLPS